MATPLERLYVLRFADGTVKVGRAIDAPRRLRSHRQEGRRHGNPIDQEWTSREHPNAHLTETTLVGWCGVQPGASVRSGREWFAGLDYAAAVEAARRIVEEGAQVIDLREPTPVPDDLDSLLFATSNLLRGALARHIERDAELWDHVSAALRGAEEVAREIDRCRQVDAPVTRYGMRDVLADLGRPAMRSALARARLHRDRIGAERVNP